MPMERLHIMVPKGTIQRAKKGAKAQRLDTPSECLRRIILSGLDAIEADLKESKREKAR